MTKLLRYVQLATTQDRHITESDIYRAHIKYRNEDPSFLQESFPAIIGYQENAAKIHYNFSAHSNTKIDANGILLIDCGGHYEEGTTDITRVCACGTVDEDHIYDYTVVLKAHIALATAQFPCSATGSDIDLCARTMSWRYMHNYLHGTGHGVGFGMNVHDGPYNLSPRATKPIGEHMIFSNEPGVYHANRYGVRLESLVCTIKSTPVETSTSEDSQFMKFDTLSLCPFDKRLINMRLISSEEKRWINSYHQHVARTLIPHLPYDLQNWIRQETSVLC